LSKTELDSNLLLLQHQWTKSNFFADFYFLLHSMVR